MADRFEQERGGSSMPLGRVLKEWTVGANDIPDYVRGVCFNDDGTCDISCDDSSSVAAVPVKQMVELPIVPKRVTAMTGPTKCYLVI